jgi:hypothetical protein
MPFNPDKFSEAVTWLGRRKISYRRVSSYQLKIGPRISYYPSKGTTFVDGEDRARDKTGLDGLADVLIELGISDSKWPVRRGISLLA